MLRTWLMALLLLSACDPSVVPPEAGAPDSSPRVGTDAPSTALPVVFPIEVFGEAGHTVSVPFTLRAGEPTTLRLRVHRPTWMETGTFADRGPKMAVRLAGSGWYEVRPQRIVDPSTWGTPAAGEFMYPVEPANVRCLEADAQFGGCLAGTYHTVRFDIPIALFGEAALAPGAVAIEFRFEGTDGESMGYRVLDFDVRGFLGESLVDRSNFTEDDPDTWAPPIAGPAAIEEGRRLWQSATLLTSPIDATPLHAHCDSCHALDGRDLTYFNFSNYAIVRRATFHGLSEEDGERIASFIRSVDLGLPEGVTRSDLGRPWNPPYQPGPGLDARPVELWAAGASLIWVLERDRDMRDFLFSPDGMTPLATSPVPGGTPHSLLGADGYLNPREMPQAFQYPDWMSWLPRFAPEDMTVDPNAILGTTWHQRYTAVRAALEADREGFLYSDRVTHTPNQPNIFLLSQVSSGWPEEGMVYRNRPEGAALNWKSGNAGDWVTTTEESVRASDYATAMGLYRNLRKWELFQRYRLEQVEGLEQVVAAGSEPYYRSPAGSRVWPTPNRDMFEIAPHFSGPGYPERSMDFNGTAVGVYWTTAWYSLQHIVNGGYHAMTVTGPVDWNYHAPHIGGAARWGDAFPSQPYRVFWAQHFMFQAIPPGSPQGNFDWPIGHLHDGLWWGGGGELASEAHQRAEAMADALLTVLHRYPTETWPRKDGGLDDVRRFEPPDAEPDAAWLETVRRDPYIGEIIAEQCHNSHFANCYYLRIAAMHDTDAVSEATLDRLLDWSCTIWPRYPWSGLASSPAWRCPE